MSRTVSDLWCELLHYSVNHSNVKTQYADTRGKSETESDILEAIKQYLCVVDTLELPRSID